MAVDRYIGRTFARYLVEALVGRGGMGVVYRAQDTHLGRIVALKILSEERSQDPAFRERFLRESRLLASIDHPNIVPVYDAGEADGELYIAMRYVPGPELRRIIEDEAPLAPSRAVGLIGQVADALDAAHAMGLVHRDVKPGNILVLPGTRDGEVGHAYLTDFGLTKSAASDSALTQVGQFVGTPGYVAPEQIEGKAIDHRADVYALGCILYNCLTGVVPYPRDSTVASLWAHLKEPPPRPSEHREGLPAALDAVIEKALAKSPTERYQTCGALAAAARDAVRGTNVVRAAAPAAGSTATLIDAPVVAASTTSGEPASGAEAAAAAAAPAGAPATLIESRTAGLPPGAPPTLVDQAGITPSVPPASPAALPTVAASPAPESSPAGSVDSRAATRPFASRLSLGMGSFLGAPIALLLALLVLGGGTTAFIVLSGDRGGGGSSPSPSPPVAGSPSPVPSGLEVYIARAGDTLESIAARFGITVDELLALNPQLSVSGAISIGIELFVPAITAAESELPVPSVSLEPSPSGSVASETASALPTPTPTPAPTPTPTRTPTPKPPPSVQIITPSPNPPSVSPSVQIITPSPIPSTPPPPPNQAPVAVNDAFGSADDTAGTEWNIPVLVNDSDPDGDRIWIVSGTASVGSVIIATRTDRSGGNGTSTCNLPCENNVLRWDPQGYHGPVTFTYVITDGKANSPSATATFCSESPVNPIYCP